MMEKHGSLIYGTEDEIMEAIREKEMTRVDAIDRETVYKLLAEKVPSPYYEDIFKAIYDLPPVSLNEKKSLS